MQLLDIFSTAKPVIGMLHIPALPGSPRNALGLDAIADRVLADAEALNAGGIDGLMIENFGDVPFYPNDVPPHTVAFMTRLALEVKRRFNLPLGINVLRNDGRAALAVAMAAGARFIRVNIYTGARLTDQGVIHGTAHEILRYRKLLGCDVKVFADVDVKHSAPLAVRKLEDDVADIVSRGCADAVIVTGSATGSPTSVEDLQVAKEAAAPAPVIAASGVDLQNAAAILKVADGLIVGTSFKRDNVTTNPVDINRARAFMEAVRRARA
jgi:membrane complex biogenesis BtpA family protein